MQIGWQGCGSGFGLICVRSGDGRMLMLCVLSAVCVCRVSACYNGDERR